tara:strand:+ start:82 stop:603 length:522 start_codon:yes stop_codon:yes gene_type:complete
MATNLQFIKSETVTSGDSSFSITDLFSDAYDVYYISVDAGQSGNAATDINARLLDSSDAEINSTSYDYANLRMNFGSSYTEQNSEDETSFLFVSGLISRTPDGSSSPGSFYLFNPYSSSSYSFITGQSVDNNQSGSKYIGVLKSTTSCTGIKFIPNNGSATLKTFTVSVYGVK